MLQHLVQYFKEGLEPLFQVSGASCYAFLYEPWLIERSLSAEPTFATKGWREPAVVIVTDSVADSYWAE